MSSVPKHIQERQVQHFSKADPSWGEAVAKGLGIHVGEPVGAD
jgi:catalase